MPKLKTLCGQDVLKIFAKFGFEKVDQEGSHVKIRRQLLAGVLRALYHRGVNTAYFPLRRAS
jgi:predicted RNA binding protein YcfA (HicA-like mRNA interferase family)